MGQDRQRGFRTRNLRMKFKRGDEVLVFYDGKLCRGTCGVVISAGRYGWATKNRHSQLTVKFTPVDDNNSTPIIATFRPSHRGRRGSRRPFTTAWCVGIIGAVENWRAYFGMDWELWYGSFTPHGYYSARPLQSVNQWYWPENMAARRIANVVSLSARQWPTPPSVATRQPLPSS